MVPHQKNNVFSFASDNCPHNDYRVILMKIGLNTDFPPPDFRHHTLYFACFSLKAWRKVAVYFERPVVQAQPLGWFCYAVGPNLVILLLRRVDHTLQPPIHPSDRTSITIHQHLLSWLPHFPFTFYSPSPRRLTWKPTLNFIFPLTVEAHSYPCFAVNQISQCY